MRKLVSILRNSQRFYNLQFHKHVVISTKKKIFWLTISSAVFPACAWAYGFMQRSKERRLQREAEFGKPFFRPFPRVIKPFPWGDGKTPFFQAMMQYWGFGEHKSE